MTSGYDLLKWSEFPERAFLVLCLVDDGLVARKPRRGAELEDSVVVLTLVLLFYHATFAIHPVRGPKLPCFIVLREHASLLSKYSRGAVI